MKKALLIVPLLAAAAWPVQAGLFITEVDPAGSGASYGADWFELTNTGPVAIDITGWKMDDNSNSFSLAVPLRNVTSIAAGQSVIFFEGTASGTTDGTIAANFESAWFGSNLPGGFTIGAYGGSGVGLSTSGDAVNIFDASGVLQASVSFSTAPTGATFDNAAGLNGTAISQASVAGANGAFVSANTAETGSPGSAVPEPSALLAIVGGVGVVFLRRRRLA
ncbi:MAG: lamin tail domain-containing protein [Chthoniobacter sp.]|uniref:lamin tail domain-containing protein n=1 Tax=Chthoniobacter sp. TaxID=2510640 RepID=UPI0032AD005B